MSASRWLLPSVVLGAALVYGYGQRRRGALGQLAEDGRSFVTMQGYSARGARLYDALLAGPAELIYGRIAREAVAQCSAGAILDVGCGPGRLAVRIAGLAPAASIAGLDVASGMAERARRRAVSAGLADRARFAVGDVAAMPFRDAQFDLVVSTFSMHHWAEPASGLAEIHRALKPGGQARIYDLAGWTLRLFRHADPVSAVEAARWFGGEARDQAWMVGPVPVLRRLCLMRGA